MISVQSTTTTTTTTTNEARNEAVEDELHEMFGERGRGESVGMKRVMDRGRRGVAWFAYARPPNATIFAYCTVHI